MSTVGLSEIQKPKRCKVKLLSKLCTVVASGKCMNSVDNIIFQLNDLDMTSVVTFSAGMMKIFPLASEYLFASCAVSFMNCTASNLLSSGDKYWTVFKFLSFFLS